MGPRMDICETSGLPIPMVPRLHLRKDYIKRNLRVWITQKCNGLVGAETVLTSWSLKLPHFMGVSIGPRMEICETSGLQIPMVPRLHLRNGYIKRNLRVWRTQKCNALVGAETVLTSAEPQTTPFHGDQYTAKNGNMLNFGVANLHATAFASKEWLYYKLRVWRAQKCNMLVGSVTVLTSAELQTTPFHRGQYRAKNGNMRKFGLTNPHGTAFAPKQWLY